MIMERSRLFETLRRGAAIMSVALFASACAVDKQEAPALAGPSGFALSLTVSADPQILPRDGSSMSTIRIVARDASGSPLKKQLLLQASAGSLNVSEVWTDDSGNATASYIAPGKNDPVSFVTIDVTPVERGDLANTNPRSVRIAVMGPAVPIASFSFSPTSVPVLDPVTFDANSSSLDGFACGSSCSYSWNFDDGSSGSGIVLQHPFTSSGVFNVTLTATSIVHGTSNSITRPIVIAPPALPVADYTTGPCAVPLPRCFRFSDMSTVGAGATINGYLINFGDNTNANAMPAEREYAVAGNYNVRLTVTDSLGRTATTTRPLVVP
jgi:PKD repeat protein